MNAATNAIAAVAVGAVVIVLFAGFANMIRGGSPNLSQKLMRWRVGLQFAAILVIIGILWFRR